MKFRKGDLLCARGSVLETPVARVTKVTRDGVVHCVNLADCQTMKEGVEFQFTPDRESPWRTSYVRIEE